ncbi:hypothetical protein [Nocardioides aurantiacus]|uniref:hypothetical protein n=1 Tax=Nocardioides aurantiacus TaxID=86796 RepID=UPI000F48BB82|nr:hypothetical protein [Nocardioides aurantiacus]
MARKKITHNEDWWATAPTHVLRCTANYKTGDRCRREALLGTNVCGSHGGLAPAVQQAAATRIQMSVDDAVKRLHSMLDDTTVEAREKVKILHDLLDRGGLGATSKVLVGVGPADPIETLFRDLLADPDATYDPRTVHPPPSPTAYTPPALDDDATDQNPRPALPARQIAADDPEDVIDALVVEGEPHPSHTVHVEGNLSHRPPKWLADDLARLI